MFTRELSNDLRAIQNQLNRRFEPFFSRMGVSDEELVTGTWIPPVDVIEEAGRILVRAELPGIRQDDIQINFAEGILTIKGERQLEKESDGRKYHRLERVYGSFTRSFTLPRAVDPEKISATFQDGVLEISVPKRDEALPRQIKIAVK